MRIISCHRLFALTGAIILCVGAIAGQASAEEPKTDQPKVETPNVAKPKVARTPSVCVGLTESACAGKPECYWRKAITTKAGKTRKAHCRKKSLHFARKKASPA